MLVGRGNHLNLSKGGRDVRVYLVRGAYIWITWEGGHLNMLYGFNTLIDLSKKVNEANNHIYNTYKNDTTCFTKSLFSKHKRFNTTGFFCDVTALNARNIAIRRSA